MLSINDFASQTEPMLALLKQLVEIESPSTRKAAVDQLGERVAQELRQLGATVTVEEQTTAGNNLYGHWPGDAQRGGLLLMCHMDTVHELGTLARQPCRVAEGRMTGPGVYDMKASIAIIVQTLKTLREKNLWPNRPLTALFTSDEEVGSRTSRPLIEHLAREAALVLCMEPGLPDGSLKTSRKGVGSFEIIARGKAAHAGTNHKDGRNAIVELAHHILAAHQLTDYERGTTINIGVVNGGTRSNVVPNEARVDGDLRVLSPEEEQRVLRWLSTLQPVIEGVTLETRGSVNRPPMPRDATMIASFTKAQTIAARLGMNLTEGGTGGGSDANFVAPLGVPVLDGLGALGNGAHSEREHIIIASLPEKAALLAALLEAWE